MPGDAGGPGLEVTQGRSVRMQKRPFLNACGLARQGCHACLPCPGRMQGHAAALWLWAGKSPPLRALTLGEFHALLGCPGHAAASWLQAGKGKNLLATHVEHVHDEPAFGIIPLCVCVCVCVCVRSRCSEMLGLGVLQAAVCGSMALRWYALESFGGQCWKQ